MFFTFLTFGAALFIESLGSLVSVIGISALFGANPIIIALAIALDVGKVVVVSLLYTYWRELSKIMKSYALLAAVVTMIITSAGAAGYLSGEFTKAIQGTKEGEIKVGVLKEQQTKYQERKKQIDDQIAKLPEKTSVNQRLRLINGFKTEQKSLDDKITAIDKELPDAQVKQIGTEAKAGPILYIAKAFNITVERAVSFVIGLIIFVFDPLAIFLIIAGNFLWAHHRPKVPLRTKEETVVEPLPPEPIAPKEELFTAPLSAPFPGMDEPWADKEVADFEAALALYEEPDERPNPESLAAVRRHMEEHELAQNTDGHLAIEEPIVIYENKPTYIPSGLLSPVNVDHDGNIELKPDDFSHMKFHDTAPIPLEHSLQKLHQSSFGEVTPDPATIVDAHRSDSFTQPLSAPPPKR